MNYSTGYSSRNKGGLYAIGIVVLVLLAVLAFPLVSAASKNLGLPDESQLQAQARLSEAKAVELGGEAVLAEARATEYEGRSVYEAARADVIRAYENTITAAGSASFQFGIAILIILLALGALWVLINFGVYVGTRGVLNAVATYKYHTAQISISAPRPLLPGGNVPVIASGIAAEHLRTGGYRVATDYNPVLDPGLVGAGARSPGVFATGNGGAAKPGDSKPNGRGRSRGRRKSGNAAPGLSGKVGGPTPTRGLFE
jgi:hypothetical protein